MNADWMLFRGDGVTRQVEFPAAPPWRRFEAAAEHRGQTYRPTADVVRIVNVALHLRRPLLIEGSPGSGKSSLAFAVSRELDLGPVLIWSINSRTTLHDGLYKYDALGRLNQLGWRIGPGDAKEQGDDIENYLKLGALGTALLPSKRPRVLLIDEIDKSDGDLPNDLLHVLENGWFDIPELERISQNRPTVRVPIDPGEGGSPGQTAEVTNGRVQADTFPFVVITSNGERELPPAFLRRCVRHTMPDPDRIRLTSVVEAHLGTEAADGAGELIGQFLTQIQEGQQLAVDQLLNAVFLLSGTRDVSEAERAEITQAIIRDLGDS
jgi:MoxR-like ATPase